MASDTRGQTLITAILWLLECLQCWTNPLSGQQDWGEFSRGNPGEYKNQYTSKNTGIQSIDKKKNESGSEELFLLQGRTRKAREETALFFT